MKSKYSMFFILRTDIPMTSGMKAVHVADLAMNLFEQVDNHLDNHLRNNIGMRWVKGKKRKIVLSAKNLDELMSIYTKAKLVDHDGLQTALRTTAYDKDSSKESETVIGIGLFGKTSKIRKITNKLELL